MKDTGITRKVDELGRVVLPVEIRRTLEIEEKDSLEIYVEGQNIIMRKAGKRCVFCGHVKNLTVFKDRPICTSCLKDIQMISGVEA